MPCRLIVQTAFLFLGKYITGINSHIIRFLKNNLIFCKELAEQY
ncbi:hypothetical protein NEICINOT_03719 [Neisseria cinerea ATCC 14685]|uniref:Uncharacterized protein n=1 Tax=Neisseria cinerea ATCC 14685 TaxID=546262 RepID=D0W241_NEICI|nr:hypothetical protein NEICINOT_03719 [Neisseria cinerea ATCC 14685]